jgi:hypothetical protein
MELPTQLYSSMENSSYINPADHKEGKTCDQKGDGKKDVGGKNDGHVPGSEVRVYTHVLGPKETQNNKAKRVAAPGARVSPRAQAGLAGAAPPEESKFKTAVSCW